MPELPEVEAVASFLRERAVGRTVERTQLVSFPSLKTYDPPLSALDGHVVTDVARHGKLLDVQVSDLHLVVHLMRAGWLHYREQMPPTPLRGGKSPISLRVVLDDGSGFDLTEAGTQKSLSIYLVRNPYDVPGIARLGPDALTISLEEFTERLESSRSQLKRMLTNQAVMAGIGNAYSDEILHAAKLSPFAKGEKLTSDECRRLYEAMHQVLTEAVHHNVGEHIASLKEEKKATLRVHRRAGETCYVCGDTIREVSYSSHAFQYCPTCQTGGKVLADRRLSRLLK